MTAYPAALAQRFASELADVMRRVRTLESRTVAIDSGMPLAVLPAVIDGSYTSGSPKAYINGASALSGPYNWLAPYVPVAGDSVLVAPIPLAAQAGQTAYVILGRFGPSPWQAISLPGGWANTGGGAVAAQYRLNVADEVEVVGDITNSGGASGTVVLTTLPAAYRPVSTHRRPLVIMAATSAYPASTSDPRIYLDSTGSLQLVNLPAGTTQVAFGAAISRTA